MFIDIGARDRPAQAGWVGDAAAMAASFADMGERVSGKAMDDRIACVCYRGHATGATEGARSHYVFAVQEELGCAGPTAAYGINPDVGIAVDVTIWGDTPSTPVQRELGRRRRHKGQGLKPDCNPAVKNLMIHVAEKKASIPA